ncbi:family 43 glycosylhydrolase [Cellulomonas hominis]
MPAPTVIPPNPLRAGFHPDPSITRVGDAYYLVNSTFEYLPGIPVSRSTDLVTWEPAGHVAGRAGQLASADIPTAGGAWAPTIRFHAGLFWVVVTDALGRGTVIFTARDVAGPWSDGTVVEGLDGIDPDLAWDTDGTCYLTYSALRLTGMGHDGIEQVRIDPLTGELLEQPRPLWSGSGLIFPEGPHLYRIGEWWYLVIAEGGTERGHCVSIARSTRPDGPFEGHPANPVLSARSTARPVQNTGHGDLVEGPDGRWYLVLLGMRTRGGTRSFSPLGRETFCTPVTWQDGWPLPAPVELSDPAGPVTWTPQLAPDAFDPAWLAVRRLPAQVATTVGDAIVLHGDGTAMDGARPAFLGFRQAHVTTRFEAVVDAGAGVGGLSLRYDEQHHLDVLIADGQVRASASVASLGQVWSAPAPDGPVRLWIATRPVPASTQMVELMSSDQLVLGFDGPDGPVTLAVVDGRFYTAESTCSFTGRVVGLHATAGDVSFREIRYAGTDR